MSVNFYNTLKRGKSSINPNKEIHGIDVPFRMIIASGSGTGKTHALCRLIHSMGKTFHEIIVCALSADEPLYDMLDNRLNTPTRQCVQFFEKGEIPPITNYQDSLPNGRIKRKDSLQRLIVFDDLVLDKKANQTIAEYFIKGRKLGFSMVYISQSFYAIPKIIRLNSQYFIIGRNIQRRDIRSILGIFSIDLSLDQFTEIYNRLTDKSLDTICIDIIHKIIRRNITEEAYSFNTSKISSDSYNTIANEFNRVPADNQ